MMPSLLVSLAFAWGDPPEPTSAESPTAEAVVVRTERSLDRDELRSWYFDLAQRTTKRRRLAAEKAVPELVALHELVGSVEGISAQESERMRAVLRGRIEWYAHRLRKQVVEEQREARRAKVAAVRATDPDSASNSGPGALGAASLIDLIQRTVNPPIWDVNGGPASIGYFSPLQALVVRAPGEVHHQLGGTLGQLRRAGP